MYAWCKIFELTSLCVCDYRGRGGDLQTYQMILVLIFFPTVVCVSATENSHNIRRLKFARHEGVFGEWRYISFNLNVGTKWRGRFPVSPGIFPVASDSSMCPGVDSASKNEYQDNPRGKGGRCVKLTTYHLHVRIVKKSGSLNLLEPCGPVQACNGTALRLPLLNGEEWSAVRSGPLTP